MSEEELNEIFNNIQFQMICEQNSGCKNEYSKQLQQRMNLYNYVIDLKQALNEIKEYVKSDKALIGCDENDKELFLRDYICCNKILQIIDKVGGNE